MLRKLKYLSFIIAFSLILGGLAPQASARQIGSGSPATPASSSTSSSSSTPPATVASTTQSEIQSGINTAAGGNVPSNPADSLSSIIRKILNVLSALAGVAAVVMIIVAGFRLVASAGSEESVKKAKSSLVYAVIGIVIVAVAQIIVHFVIANVT